MTPFPSLEAAIGTIMLQAMSEGLSMDTPPDRLAKLDALRDALKAVWPDEMKTASERIAFVPKPEGGVRAMYSGDEQ